MEVTTMRELTVSEIDQVAGGRITRTQARNVLMMYGTSILLGAAMGALAGPGGMLAGAVYGASRAAVTGGVTALVWGALNLH
jgi:uncharacterized membrane protein